MKARIFIILLLISLCSRTEAQSTFLEVYSGISRSDFDFDNWTNAHSVPVGIKVMYGGVLKFGLDISTNVLYPYNFVARDNDDQEIYRNEVQLNQANMFLLIEFNKEGVISPYVRGGGGVYTGKISMINPNDTETISLSLTKGYNYGGGVIIGNNFKVILEYSLFNSNLVSDSNSSIDFQSNWSQLILGFGIKLKSR
ncbi:MAG: outer membrane beta-barrel protein [Cyclobacteriaceae bacterium]|nr:outer membrane beta-barrel protein [Cyclobacteriaceae bacterium]